MRRPCLDCGTPTRGNRCPQHQAERYAAIERQRGDATQRGYNRQYRNRKQAPEYLNATHCSACGVPFTPDNPRTAGHVTAIRKGDTTGEIQPECRRCNYGWRRTDR